MGNIYRKGDVSAGADGGAPTALTALNQATKSYFNGQLVALVGDQHEAHTVGRQTHQLAQRQITSGSSTMFFEGKAVARTNDPIADGDKCGQGSTDSFAG